MSFRNIAQIAGSAMTAQSAMPVPMDRSMPEVMITNVVPSANVPMTTVENRTDVTLV